MVEGLVAARLRNKANLPGETLPRRKEISVTKLLGAPCNSFTDEGLARSLIDLYGLYKRRRVAVRPLLDKYTALIGKNKVGMPSWSSCPG